MELLFSLLGNFLQVGLFSFGGGYATIPLIQEYIVEGQGWLTYQELTDILTISQMTPGPIAVNTSTFVGTRIAGFPGAVFATVGCVLPGVLMSVALYYFFRKYNGIQGVSDVLAGLRATSVGLIAAAAGSILLIALTGSSELGQGSGIGAATAGVFAGMLFMLRKWKWSPMLVMAVSGGLGALLFCVLGL